MMREEIIEQWRIKLRPIIAEVMNNLQAEETRRAMYYESIRARKRRTKQSIPNK